MEVLAVLFLIGCLLRAVLWFFDTGFGGPVWDGIMWASSVTWLIGLLMAVHVLTGIAVTR